MTNEEKALICKVLKQYLNFLSDRQVLSIFEEDIEKEVDNTLKALSYL